MSRQHEIVEGVIAAFLTVTDDQVTVMRDEFYHTPVVEAARRTVLMASDFWFWRLGEGLHPRSQIFSEPNRREMILPLVHCMAAFVLLQSGPNDPMVVQACRLVIGPLRRILEPEQLAALHFGEVWAGRV
ncbi:hypothetical protein JNJ66_04190 [Candidatus Saccharibacteria bacterium]|nr:hypothetical protein [Candidatus Saccharibacteria bacterium]